MPQTGQERELPRFRSLPCAVYLRAFEMPAGHRVEMHDHPWGQLMYAASGTLRASTERHSYLVPAQRALWIPPGVRHAAEACNPVLFRSLYLDRSLPGGCRVLEVSGLLRELLLRAAEFPREYPPGGEAERLMQVVADEVGRLREAPLNLPLPGDPRLRQIRPSRTVIASLARNEARRPLRVTRRRYWMKAVSPSKRIRSVCSSDSSGPLGMVASTYSRRSARRIRRFWKKSLYSTSG